MSLHGDLFRQAGHLANLEPRRPRQASLRRAVSSAYYSLFHLLVDEATALMFGHAGSRRRLRDVLARGFAHGSMVAACKSFEGGTLPDAIASVVAPLPIPAQLQTVAAAFRRLQEERHRADYNRALPFSRPEVLNLLDDTKLALEAWHEIRNDDAAKFFLMALPLWEHIRR